MSEAGDPVERLVAAYQRVERERMRDMPLCNDALEVEAVGFCDWNGHKLGVVTSPWFINLVLIPGAAADWSAHNPGDKIAYTFPSGIYQFVHGELDGVGDIHTSSLMSPVHEVQTQEAARSIAEEVMRQLWVEREPEHLPNAAAKPAKAISRRDLLRGGKHP